jgi:hypothetical protein
MPHPLSALGDSPLHCMGQPDTATHPALDRSQKSSPSFGPRATSSLPSVHRRPRDRATPVGSGTAAMICAGSSRNRSASGNATATVTGTSSPKSSATPGKTSISPWSRPGKPPSTRVIAVTHAISTPRPAPKPPGAGFGHKGRGTSNTVDMAAGNADTGGVASNGAEPRLTSQSGPHPVRSAR